MRGRIQQGNIVRHSRKERRYRCLTCGHTFAASKGTPFYRLHTPEAHVTCVLTLLAHGCPLPAIVAAFGWDERTVAAWQARAGKHCEQVHHALVVHGQVDLGQVQADELWIKLVGRRIWLALALAVPSRLWLGGVLSPQRDGALIEALVRLVRQCAQHLGILVCVDGLPSYVTAFRRLFRVPLRTGAWRRPRLTLAPGFLLGQVVKRREGVRVVEVLQRAVVGTVAEITARVQALGTGRGIHTAYIERLNATFRSHLAPLVRRSRGLARSTAQLQAGVYLLGTSYNFCCPHASLRRRAPTGPRLWEAVTPAMAAGLTDHPWSVSELLHYRIPPPLWQPRKRPGPKPKTGRSIPWKLRPGILVLA